MLTFILITYIFIYLFTISYLLTFIFIYCLYFSQEQSVSDLKKVEFVTKTFQNKLEIWK